MQNKKRTRADLWPARCACFIAAVVVLAVAYSPGAGGDASESRRLLEAANSTLAVPTDDTFFGIGYPVKVGGGGIILYVLGVFYMFAAIAIVCDEFFVPALDVLTEWTGVSDDVAGATFMAAGGSAPELFTSLIGTFKESSVGFGTIVGSAVFNVLFVIGMCAIFSKELLSLTWWPLARDSTYYSLSLLVLAIFFNDKEIQMWEALVLLAMYFGYVGVMKNNARLRAFFTRLLGKNKVDPNNGPSIDSSKENAGGKSPFLNPHNFRSGILSHMLNDTGFNDRLGRTVVAALKGDVKGTFQKIDKDDSGFVDKTELVQLMTELEIPHEKKDVESALKIMDTSKDNQISFDEFQAWYGAAETKINTAIAAAFNEIDKDGNGFIHKEELEELMKACGHAGESESKRSFSDNAVSLGYDIEEVWAEATKASARSASGKITRLSRADFSDWYETSLFYKQRIEEESSDNDDEDQPLNLSFPESTGSRIKWVILAPLCFSLAYTTPDVRAPGKRHLFGVAFVMSILWIMVYSFLMVEWATMIGGEVGIPDSVMGLTFLAAGTSIPDLLTSVIVAQQGHGDMAVSSSIGSNIFDVLVGLPLPWFLYCCVNPNDNGNKVIVQADTLFVSIIILFLMLATVISIIALNKWQLTKNLGMTMFFLYFIFVVQDLLRQYGKIPTCFVKDC